MSDLTSHEQQLQRHVTTRELIKNS